MQNAPFFEVNQRRQTMCTVGYLTYLLKNMGKSLQTTMSFAKKGKKENALKLEEGNLKIER